MRPGLDAGAVRWNDLRHLDAFEVAHELFPSAFHGTLGLGRAATE